MSENSEALGQRLQAARERKGLSAQKAADELHLDRWVIEGLESGDYARIGPSVYAKGHLKRYAELLGLPAEDVLAGFDGLPAPEPQAQPATMRMRTSAPAGRPLPWLKIAGFAVVALLTAAVLWWRPWHARAVAPVGVGAPAVSAPTGQSESAAGAAAGTDGSPLHASGAGSAEPPTAAPLAPMTSGAATSGAANFAAATPGAANLAAANSTSTPDPVAASGRARLRLSFLGDSWVDVRDSRGQRLFAGIGHVNNVRSMAGDAPFRVYLKAAGNVRLEINNHQVAIGPQYVVGSAARFEAGADGVLRRDPRAAAAPSAPRPRG